MENLDNIALPTAAKTSKKITKGMANVDFDPWSNKGPLELPTLVTNELPPVSISDKEIDVTWNMNNEAVLPIPSTQDSFYVSNADYIPNTELPESTSFNNKEDSNWGNDLYFSPKMDYEQEMNEKRMKQMLESDKLFVAERPKSKTKIHPHQSKEFNWESCSLEESLSFKLEHIPKIVETLVTQVSINPSYEAILAPANGLFLFSRYAHQIQSPSLFNGLLNLALHTIQNIVKERKHDIIVLCFWITNCTQLLYYLKRDIDMSIATIEQQVLIPEIIYDAYTSLVQNCIGQLDRLIEKCMLEHDIIPGLKDVEFKDNRSRPRQQNGKRTKSRSLSPRQLPHSPRTLTTILASIAHVFGNYQMHSSIAQRIMSQLFYFISASLFNFILKNRTYCCRAKALQLRMNVSYLEEWARSYSEDDYTYLTNQFKPLIQLLELLQCASHLKSLESFLDTVSNFSSLTSGQINRALQQYYYEVDEPLLNKDMLNLVKQCATKDSNAPITNQSKLLVVKSIERKGLKITEDPELGLKSRFHMLPFGTPNQVEMDDWYYDYAPFLPLDIVDQIITEE